MTNTTSQDNLRPEVCQCLAQADLLLWLAGWLRPPATPPAPQPTRDDLRTLIDSAALGSDAQLHECVAALHEAMQATTPEDHRHEHHRLFDAGIACAISESAYVRRDKGAILGDVCGFYRAFGFQPAADAGDKPDHMACELEFVAMLLLLLAKARQDRDAAHAELTEKALASFAGDHLDAWLALFCEQLHGNTRLSLYTNLAAALHATWQALVQQHALPRAEGIEAGEPRTEPESPYECGMAAASGVSPQAPVQLWRDGQPLAVPASPSDH